MDNDKRLFLGTLRKHLGCCERWVAVQEMGTVTSLCTRHLVHLENSEPASAHSLLRLHGLKTSVGSCLLFFLFPPPLPLVNCSCGQGPEAKSPTMPLSTGSSQDLFLNRKFPVVQQTFLSAFITHIHLFWQILGLG